MTNLSGYFWEYFGLFAMVFTIAVVVIGVAALAFRGEARRATDPESAFMWLKPVLVLSSAIAFIDEIGLNSPSSVVFGVSFVVGLCCGLTTVEPMLSVRDSLLAAMSAILVVWTFFERLSPGSDYRLVYQLLLAAMGAGLLLGGLRKVPSPLSAMAALGALEVVDFLLSPFGPSAFPGLSFSVATVGIVGALIMGILIRLRSEFVIYLAGTSIALLSVILPIFLWLEFKNYPGIISPPDWTIFFGWLGVAVGYPLTRFPLSTSGVKDLGC